MQKKIYLFSFTTALWLALSAFYSGPPEAPSRMTLSPSGDLTEFYAVPPPPCDGPSTDNGDFPAGQMTQWVVPAGVTEVTILTQGGDGGGPGYPGGQGATVQSTIPVNPGDVLHVIVAGTASFEAGGGGTGVYNFTAEEVLIVAGGGGGGSQGQGGQAAEAGGNAGGSAAAGGINGSGGSTTGAGSGGGGAFSAGADGNQFSAFSGGGGGQGVPNGGNGGIYNGNTSNPAGAFGFGGGGSFDVFSAPGGGGGYSGGGGGLDGGNGGGGGSFVHPFGTNTTITAGADGGGANAPGAVRICYTPGPVCDISIDNITPSAESCPGANDGSITVTASCTTCSGIEYSIDGVNFQAGNAFSGLVPNSYIVTVRDAGSASCEATGNTTVNGGPTTDSDNDGTPDCNDGCPSDPLKTAPGDCGCGVADTDSDNDGVADCNDNCINTANPGQEDADNDGYGDACDQCPTDPDKYEAGICGCFFPETSCIDACAVFNSLIAKVMNDNTSLNNGQKNALVTKVHHAKLNFEEGDNTTAINQLNAFINQVEGLSGGNNKPIPDPIAADWIARAQNIIYHINNGTAYCIQPLIAAPSQVTATEAGQGLMNAGSLTVLPGQAGVQEPDGGGSPVREGMVSHTFEPVQLEAFPNPFTQQTTLQYYLPADGRVQLSILSIHGQVVAKVVDGQQAAGLQRVEWRDGNSLPEGVYFARLQTETGVSTLQLVLAK